MDTLCRVSGVPPGWECSGKLRRVGSNDCKAVLTGGRGEYLRVVGIHSDQNNFVFPTRPNARTLHFGDARMRSRPPKVFRTLPNGRNS